MEVLGAFSADLNGSFQKCRKGKHVNLDLKDFERDAVMRILNFLYSAEMDLNGNIIGQVSLIKCCCLQILVQLN